MKTFAVIIIASIIISLVGVVGAIEQEEISTVVTWSNPTPYQGSTVSVSIFLKSNSLEELKVYYIGLNFDWMEPDTFIGRDLSADPVTIPSGGSYTFYSMNIDIPQDASLGAHNYFVGIDGLNEDSSSFTWDSQNLMVIIQDSEEKDYNEILNEVVSKIDEAENAEYRSTEAQSLLEQAKNSYDDAISLANQKNWNESISALQAASALLDQAQSEEQNYVEDNNSQQDNLLIIVAVGLVLIVIVLIIFLMFRRSKKGSVEQSIEE